MRTCRVAIVTQSYFICGGGLPSVVQWLIEGFNASRDFDVTVFYIATSADDSYSTLVRNPATWFRQSLKGPERDGVVQWGVNLAEIEVMRYLPRRGLSRALRDFDIIQVVTGSPALANVAIGLGVPVVIQVATLLKWERAFKRGSTRGAATLWRQFMAYVVSPLETRGLKRADVVLVENDEMHKLGIRLGQENTYKIPPGVDTRRFVPAATWRKDGYLLSVCRLDDARKGLDRLVRAYSSLIADDHEMPGLVLAGSCTLDSSIVALIDELGVRDRIEIRSNVPSEELADIYRGASVFVQTSHEEGLGISVLEAMACGLPVVATDTHGSRETVVDGVSGVRVPQRNECEAIDGIICGIRRMLTDDGQRYGAAGRARVEAFFSADVCFAQYLALLRGLGSRVSPDGFPRS
jgi:glycosyltransferase involved in cell wall biosynthesis